MTTTISRIRKLNDRCRLGLDRDARIVITRACLAAFAPDEDRVCEVLAQSRLMKAIRQHRFDTEDEHDFGRVIVDGVTVLFKIDYYDLDLVFGSEDPADAAITRRVLTIMLPSDY